MVTVSGLIDSLLSTLSANSELSGIRFVQAFPDSELPNPMKQTYVAIGISSAEIKETALGGYYGIKNDAELIGGRAEAKLHIRIFVPKLAGAAGCTGAFSKLCGALLANTELCIQSISCSEARYENTCGAFAADAEVTITCFVGKATPEQEESV